jgi:hypothetical protein
VTGPPRATTYPQIYCDDGGDSHFGVVEVELASTVYAPPAPPLDVSAPESAERFVFFRAPAGWTGDFHPSPRRQLFIGLAGELEVTVSDGETRRFKPGSVVLLEDTRGKGHATRVLGDAECHGVFVHLE